MGKGEPCHTAQERLYPIFENDKKKVSLDALEEAFSVEKVTNDFFRQYREKFLELCEYLDSNPDFIKESAARNFTSEQFAKKLMGQIVFLYFIQKKGWLGVEAIPVFLSKKQYINAYYTRGHGNKAKELMPKVYYVTVDGNYRTDIDHILRLSDEDQTFLSSILKGKPWGSGPKDFMRQIFNGCEQAGKNYFDDYLEPLFYTGLNEARKNEFYAPLHRKIPFLNGGLFEQLDHYDWQNNDFLIPNEIFSNSSKKGERDADGILDIFDRYNFTMNEDEPMEREVAIDPEMLGKVFENLLEVKDRKSKGAFYTPREIVHYMCQQSLIQYLTTETGISKNDIEYFIIYGEFFKDTDTEKNIRVPDNSRIGYHLSIDKNKTMHMPESIFSYKKNVNRLQEIDNLLANVKIVDPAVGSGAFPLGMLNEIVKARDTLTSYLSIEMNAFDKKSFYAYGRKPYDLKTATIKNCIFACDIEPSAVDIAKLRLWLSIVIEDEITEDTNNGMFNEHNKPRPLPNLDCNIICGNSLMDEFHGISFIKESNILNNMELGVQQNLFQKGTDFMIKKLIEHQDKLFFTKNHHEKEEIIHEIQNIYNQIITKQLEEKGGKYIVEEYYKSIEKPSRPFILWQLYYPKVFRDNGGFDICIGNPPYFLYQASHKDEIDQLRRIDELKPAFGGKLNAYKLFLAKALHSLVKKDGIVCYIFQNSFLADKQAALLRKDIFENFGIIKIDSFPERDSVKKRVFEAVKMSVCIALFIKSRNDSPFTINIWKDKNKSDGIQTIYTKRDIYSIDPDTLSIPRLNQEYLPLIVHINELKDTFHMKCYEGELNMTVHRPYFTKDTHEPKILKGASIQRYFWTEQMSQGEIEYVDEKKYLAKFQRSAKSKHHIYQRIAMQGMTGANDKIRIISTIVPQGVYLANSCNYILPDGKDIYYLLGIFNSKLINWYFRCFSTNSNVNGYEVDNLPIPIGTDEDIRKISSLVQEILLLKNENPTCNTKKLEDEIDSIVYSIYDLSSDEINIIENI